MTDQETAKLCAVIVATYPSHFRDYSDSEKRTMLGVWKNMLEGYTYDQANAGLKMFIRSDKKGFPPVAGQVIDQIEKIKPRSDSNLTEAEAWSIVKRAIENSTYNAEEEFEALPDTLKRAVGSPANLKEWATMEDGDIKLPVIESNVMRSYRSASKMANEEKLIPESVRNLIGVMFTNQIEQKEVEDND